MNRATDVFLGAVAVLVFIVAASTLIGWDEYTQARDDHRNMMEKNND